MSGRLATIALLAVSALASSTGDIQAQGASAVPAPADGRLFVVEIRTGPNWDTSKPANEQAYFSEHSANLRRLREAGSLVLGARYSDKGFVVLSAATDAEARAMMQQDPSIEHGVFVFELHEFNVFYEGTVRRPPVRTPL